MLRNRSVLPRLDYLLAFEAAAELESFAAAAKELNVSETAISRKIRLLEEHFGCALFLRGHRSVHLTDEGHKLLQGIGGPLQSIAKLSQDMLRNRSRGVVRISATHSVAALWLMPRLQRFHEAHRGITINLLSSDLDAECMGADHDLTILRGDGDWPGFTADRLFGETVFPVCAPGDLKDHPRIDRLGDLADHHLIDVSNMHIEWLNWKTWLQHMGEDPDRVRHATFVNTYPLAIQAAMDGLGIALGWGHLVDRHLQSGALIRPLGDAHVRTRSGYYLLRRDGARAHAESEVVADWLLRESAQRERYGQTA